ncbi:hypothetical protein AVEN_158753-1 [Araneus ventricosus]|uniref:Uncharacterized protein n=1 Tax=Araneus ventricosus TaxID=182803 RepID=A0A4Y2QFB0_ARAVE|nr:hypothetical protein AVEN_158753-1 [Araneus ventricosus]
MRSGKQGRPLTRPGRVLCPFGDYLKSLFKRRSRTPSRPVDPERVKMKQLAFVFLVALVHYASAEGYDKSKPAANQPSYQAVYQPYNYRPYGVSGQDSYRSRQGQYPSTSYDQGGQHLYLSGGIYRPYDYSDTYGQDYPSNYYKPYNYDSSYYYDDSATRHVKYPYKQYGVPAY